MKITLYRSLPFPLGKIIRSAYSLLPFSIRMGKTYWDTKDLIKRGRLLDRKAIEEWQLSRLREIISLAYETTSGYRQLYDECKVKPGDLRELSDLRIFPFVSKELMRDNTDDFTSSATPKWKMLRRTTGGSTGIPFGFYLTQKDIEREVAFLHSSWERAGWKLGDVSAILRGAFVGSEHNLSEYDPFLRDLRLTSYFLTDKTYPKYRELVLRKKVKHLQAYPSAASLLADLVIRNGDEGKLRFSLLLLGSENIYDWQKSKIGKAFPESRLFAWYGHAEQVLFAPMCENSEQFHLDPFYGVGELLDAHNEEVGVGQTGELVGTSLWNTTTPFIRYRTMDIARKGNASCAACGRQYQLLESIEGRLQELIVTGTGRYISMTALNMHSGVFDRVKQFQFYQKEPGRVTFRIVKNTGYTEADTEKIRLELMTKLGSDMNLEIAFVDSIEVPTSGKFRFLIQELHVEGNDAGRR